MPEIFKTNNIFFFILFIICTIHNPQFCCTLERVNQFYSFFTIFLSQVFVRTKMRKGDLEIYFFSLLKFNWGQFSMSNTWHKKCLHIAQYSKIDLNFAIFLEPFFMQFYGTKNFGEYFFGKKRSKSARIFGRIKFHKNYASLWNFVRNWYKFCSTALVLDTIFCCCQTLLITSAVLKDLPQFRTKFL